MDFLPVEFWSAPKIRNPPCHQTERESQTNIPSGEVASQQSLVTFISRTTDARKLIFQNAVKTSERGPYSLPVC